MENINQTTVPSLTDVVVSVDAMLAALSCAAGPKDQRLYLQSVFVHQVDEDVRIVGTDGARMFIHARQKGEGEQLPDWLPSGVIIPAEGLKPRLSLIGDVVKIAYAIGSPHVRLSSYSDDVGFRMRPIDGTFPEYQRIIDQMKVFEARKSLELESVAYVSKYFKGVGDLAKIIGSEHVRIHGSGREDEPTLITFPASPGALLVLMPLDQSRMTTALPAPTVSVLKTPLNGTLAALRAHRTRWTDKIEGLKGKAKKEADEKIVEYDQRIAAVLAKISAVPALPAPDPEADDGETPEEPVTAVTAAGGETTLDDYAIVGAVEPTSDEPPARYNLDGDVDDNGHEIETGNVVAFRPVGSVEGNAPVGSVETGPDQITRAHLTKNQRKREMRRFVAFINRKLSDDHDGLTLGQLADGVPIEGWFDAGLTPEQAAERALDWRRTIAAVIHVPDQVEAPQTEAENVNPAPVGDETAVDDLGTAEDMAAQVRAIFAIEPGSLDVEFHEPMIQDVPAPEPVRLGEMHEEERELEPAE